MTYEEFISRIEKSIWKLTHTYSVKGYDAEDLKQECLMKCYDVFNGYNDDFAITTFIYPVLENHLKQLAREQNTIKRTNYLLNNKKNGALKDIKNYNFNQLLQEPCYNDKEVEVLSIAFKILKTFKQRDIVERVLNGEKQVAIAKELGVTKQSVSKHYKNYIDLVKLSLEKENE